MQEQVILVNERDEQVGVMEKLQAHQKALLHRAFSVFIFDKNGEMLLQQRASTKYHSAGKWSNACCSHPRPNENLFEAANRRLKEELGFEVELKKIFDFIYKAQFENSLTENEFDHVFVGEYNGVVNFNPDEVQDYSYHSLSSIKESIQRNPSLYTEWFLIAFPKVEKWWRDSQR